ncbi:hypothetical protein [Schauerella aestuarii]|uniref:hypothetical protein n=1 Tax=Schauerella aestuarii TaxID=2511204 RepID=UPI00136D4549|nr:hypothetical protein [Achromobacter aestuarii]
MEIPKAAVHDHVASVFCFQISGEDLGGIDGAARSVAVAAIHRLFASIRAAITADRFGTFAIAARALAVIRRIVIGCAGGWRGRGFEHGGTAIVPAITVSCSAHLLLYRLVGVQTRMLHCIRHRRAYRGRIGKAGAGLPAFPRGLFFGVGVFVVVDQTHTAQLRVLIFAQSIRLKRGPLIRRRNRRLRGGFRQHSGFDGAACLHKVNPCVLIVDFVYLGIRQHAVCLVIHCSLLGQRGHA